jgi:hypothetical protein
MKIMTEIKKERGGENMLFGPPDLNYFSSNEY